MQEKEVNNKLIKNSFISFLIFLFITALFFVIIIFTSNSVRKNNTDKYGGTIGINSNYIEGYFITEPFLDCKKITDVEKVAIGRNDNDFVYIILVSSQNEYIKLDTYVLISQDDGKIKSIHVINDGYDNLYDYGIIGCDSNDYYDYFKYDYTFAMQSALVKKAVGIAFKQYKMLVARYE